MILTGNEIEKRIGDSIIIQPFNKDNINPNSYNLTLDDTLIVYEEETLDLKCNNRTKMINIPESGYVLSPGELYLAQTLEYTETHLHVPLLIGRSSIARLGLFVHATAGFGDIGYCGNWTLQLIATKRIRIYPNIKICQIYYVEPKGDISLYISKYQRSIGIQASKMHEELS